MKMWKTQKLKIIFITGPTASGKTDLALFLAKKFNGEIINADSRQVYQYLNIGSGKVLKKEEIKLHHLLSIASPRKNYSLARFLKDSEKAIKKILKKNKIPIFCGGTIFYLKAIKEGWQLPKVKPNYKLRKELEKKNLKDLYQKLKKLDPRRAQEIDPDNKRRIIRALEIIYSLKKVPEIKKEPKYQILILAPKIEKEILFKKIKKRLEKRVKGIIQEIKKLREILSFQRIINFGLEYKWFGLYLKGEIDLKTAKEKCYLDILRFAKRQLRELKKFPEVIWVNNKKEAIKIVEKFLKNF